MQEMNNSHAKNLKYCPIYIQSELNHLKHELEYHLDKVREATKEAAYHSVRASSISQEMELLNERKIS